MPSEIVAPLLVLVAIAVIPAAHRLGRRAGMRETIPWRPVFQLVDHRTRCLGMARGDVERELGPVLGVPDWAWAELAVHGRPLVRRPARAVPR